MRVGEGVRVRVRVCEHLPSTRSTPSDRAFQYLSDRRESIDGTYFAVGKKFNGVPSPHE